MPKFLNSPTVGIDVSADFSFVAILAPNGDIYKKAFRINHDVKGFNYLFEQIKKVEEEFNTKTAIFMESTGVYHLSLFHFLNKNFDNTFVINPLVTKCNKNGDIRKVKNDKKDSLAIAKIGKYQEIKLSQGVSLDIFLLRSLEREYYKLTDTCSVFKKKLSSSLRVTFPGYNTIFSDITSNSSIAILSDYPTPQAILAAQKDKLVSILKKQSRKGLDWSEKKYNKLIDLAKEAILIGVPLEALAFKITSSINFIVTFETEINNLKKEIDNLITSADFPDQLKKNIELVDSIPGIGQLTAVTLVAEIGDIEGFIKPKHLVAFFGIDCSVNESGKFKGNQNKISKRGTRIGRRALYAVALASIRKNRNGVPINKVLLEYYETNLKGKKAKVALVAIMHKQMFLENKSLSNAA